MKLVDSIEAVKKYMRFMSSTRHNLHGNDKLIIETAKKLGLKRDWLSQNLKLEREAPKELKEAIRGGKITVSSATEIMKAPKENREELTKEILEEEKIPIRDKITERVNISLGII